MVIYVDTLVFTNIIIDYLILNLTSIIVKRTYNLSRLIISSLLGGFSSLYIFVDTFVLIDIIYQVTSAAIMLIILNGRCKLKTYIYSVLVFMSISFLIYGLVNLLSNNVENQIFISQSGVFYLNISSTLLIFSSLAIYFAVILIRRFSDRKDKLETAKLKIKAGNNTVEFNAMIDSGNSVCDPFGLSEVFIINETQFELLESSFSSSEINRRRRVIPIKTVSDKILLKAIRCDVAQISENGVSLRYERPIAACSVQKIDNGFDAIISQAAIHKNE